jgi:hypothetical protein
VGIAIPTVISIQNSLIQSGRKPRRNLGLGVCICRILFSNWYNLKIRSEAPSVNVYAAPLLGASRRPGRRRLGGSEGTKE